MSKGAERSSSPSTACADPSGSGASSGRSTRRESTSTAWHTLGDFVELETVSAGAAGPDDRREHDRIASALGLDPSATVEGSYIDLLEPIE